jgi:hypothetical protein
MPVNRIKFLCLFRVTSFITEMQWSRLSKQYGWRELFGERADEKAMKSEEC